MPPTHYIERIISLPPISSHLRVLFRVKMLLQPHKHEHLVEEAVR
jgi:hypothetical protein